MKNLTEAINNAKKECDNNDKILHAKKVRSLAHEYLSLNNDDATPEIKMDNHMSLRFHKGESDTPEAIYMTVNGKSFEGADMDAMICKIDRIGPEFKSARINGERNSNLKAKGRQIARIAQVDITRKAINEPIKIAAEGNSMLISLLRLLGRTIKQSVQIGR